MKLSNQQLNALVAVICQKEDKIIKEQHKEKRKALMAKHLEKSKKWRDIIKSIPADVLEYMKGCYYNENRFNLESIQEHFVSDEIPKSENADRQETKNKILIASIDSKTMEELKKKLKIEL